MQFSPGRILLSADEVCDQTRLSRATIWRLEASGKFPKRRQITRQRVAWIAEEVLEWARSRPAAKPDPQLAERLQSARRSIGRSIDAEPAPTAVESEAGGDLSPVEEVADESVRRS